MNPLTDNFYVLEYASRPGIYYSDNQLGSTSNVLLAERYSSAKEALKYMKQPSNWNVCIVHINVEHV